MQTYIDVPRLREQVHQAQVTSRQREKAGREELQAFYASAALRVADDAMNRLGCLLETAASEGKTTVRLLVPGSNLPKSVFDGVTLSDDAEACLPMFKFITQARVGLNALDLVKERCEAMKLTIKKTELRHKPMLGDDWLLHVSLDCKDGR